MDKYSKRGGMFMPQYDEEWHTAMQWLWEKRKNAPAGADIWDLWFHRAREEAHLWTAVNCREYVLSPMLVYRRRSGVGLAQWSSRDALVLKWAALHADRRLPVHVRCEHRRGHGGVMKSVARLDAAIKTGRYRFVLRTDIKGYYRHIQKEQLWRQILNYVSDERVRHFIRQYLYYSVEDGGEIHTPETGIPCGCALSPLLAGRLLYHIDADFNATEDIYYARYMDDFILLTQTRWRLRQCVARLSEYFDWGGFKKHPEKTYIGKLSHGMDWLGAQFNEHGATGVADRALRHHRERCLRLYEQVCQQDLSHEEAMQQVQAYRNRWLLWAGRLISV